MMDGNGQINLWRENVATYSACIEVLGNQPATDRSSANLHLILRFLNNNHPTFCREFLNRNTFACLDYRATGDQITLTASGRPNSDGVLNALNLAPEFFGKSLLTLAQQWEADEARKADPAYQETPEDVNTTSQQDEEAAGQTLQIPQSDEHMTITVTQPRQRRGRFLGRIKSVITTRAETPERMVGD